jgi:hypothetical protein
MRLPRPIKNSLLPLLLFLPRRKFARSSRPPMIFSTAARSLYFQQHSAALERNGRRPETFIRTTTSCKNWKNY